MTPDVEEVGEQADSVSVEALTAVQDAFEFEYSYSSDREYLGHVLEDYYDLVVEGQPEITIGLPFSDSRLDLLRFRDEKSRTFLQTASQSPNFDFIRRKVSEEMLPSLKMLGGNEEQYAFYLGHALAGHSTEYRLMLNSLERLPLGQEQKRLAAQLLSAIRVHEIYFKSVLNRDPEMEEWTLQTKGERSSVGDFLASVSNTKASLRLYKETE